LKALKEYKIMKENDKARDQQMSEVSHIFGVLQRFTSPESAGEVKEQALNELSESCTNIRQSHQQMDRILTESGQECQICFEKFSSDQNLLFSCHPDADASFLNTVSE